MMKPAKPVAAAKPDGDAAFTSYEMAVTACQDIFPVSVVTVITNITSPAIIIPSLPLPMMSTLVIPL